MMAVPTTSPSTMGPMSIPVQRGGTTEVQSRLSLLLWGGPKVGKTTLAATAPGEKLWINLDEDGFDSVRSRKDCHLLDISGLTNDVFFNQVENTNPLGLSGFLDKRPEVETVVLDSATALFERCLEQGVLIDRAGMSRKGGFTPTMAVPGVAAYGARTAHFGAILRAFLRVTRAKNRHFIVIAHEDTPKYNDDGTIRAIKIMLSEKAVNNTTMKFSEIWYMSDGSQGRRVAIRPIRKMSPMGTRMFKTGADEKREFVLRYDATRSDKGQEHLISTWYAEWEKGGGVKIPLPTPVRTD